MSAADPPPPAYKELKDTVQAPPPMNGPATYNTPTYGAAPAYTAQPPAPYYPAPYQAYGAAPAQPYGPAPGALPPGRVRRPICAFASCFVITFLIAGLAPVILAGIFGKHPNQGGGGHNENLTMFVYMPLIGFGFTLWSLVMWRRRSRVVLWLGIVCMVTLLALVFQAAIYAAMDFNAKCTQFENLGQRSFRMAYGLSCPVGVVLLWLGILLGLGIFASVSLCMFCCAFRSSRRFARINAVRLNGARDLPNPRLFGRIILFVLGITFICIVAGVFYPVTFNTHPARVAFDDVTCPAGNIFYDKPHTADLQCCQWNNPGTCVNVNKLFAASLCDSSPGSVEPSCQVCDLKPSVWAYFSDICDKGTNAAGQKCQYQQSRCGKMSGLFTCSMFAYRANDYMTWDNNATSIGEFRMCSSFCHEWYNECIPYLDDSFSSAEQMCATIANADIVNDNNGTATNCFSAANPITPNRILLLVVAILLALILS